MCSLHALLVVLVSIFGCLSGTAHATPVNLRTAPVFAVYAYDCDLIVRNLAARSIDSRVQSSDKALTGLTTRAISSHGYRRTSAPNVNRLIATRGAAEVAKHHAWPKYLGGAAKQDLVTLPRKVREAFHSGLDKLLPRQWGAEYYQKLAPAARDQVLRDLADYTRAFDTKHGTSIFDALVKAGFPAP